MKKITTLAILLLLCMVAWQTQAQQGVSINTSGATPNASAMLDVSATNKGMLVPRMTNSQVTGISSPATGLLVYQTDVDSGFYYYTGARWVQIAAVDTSTKSAWVLGGNKNTNASTQFIGTADNKPLKFRVNNQPSGEINGSNENTALGYLSIVNNTGTGNTSYGALCLYNNSTGNDNVSVGYGAMAINTTGNNNTAVGVQSLSGNGTGTDNTAIGYHALFNSTGANNTAVGYGSLLTVTSGGSNTAIGNGADVSTGTLTNATAIGAGATVNASNKVVIGNSSVTSIGGYANWSNFSDGRFKRNIQENVPGLAFINKLKPVTYTLDVEAINNFNGKKYNLAAGSNMIYTGFLAQDVEQAANELNFHFSGVDKPADPAHQTYALRYGDFVVPLVKAIQEQQAIIETLQKEIEELKQKVK